MSELAQSSARINDKLKIAFCLITVYIMTDINLSGIWCDICDATLHRHYARTRKRSKTRSDDVVRSAFPSNRPSDATM